MAKKVGYYEYRVLKVLGDRDDAMSEALMEGLALADSQPILGDKADHFEVYAASSFYGGMLYTLRRWTVSR